MKKNDCANKKSLLGSAHVYPSNLPNVLLPLYQGERRLLAVRFDNVTKFLITHP